jgi:hypothetical protein
MLYKHGAVYILFSLLLLSVTGFLLAFSSDAATPPAILDPNVQISAAGFGDTEPTLAVNPRNEKNLAVAWMHWRGLTIDIRARASSDGGRVWGPITTFPHVKPGYQSADPTLVYDRQGNLYLAWLDFEGEVENFTDGVVFVARSADGGTTWEAPVKVRDVSEGSDAAVDRPWLAVDRSGGPRDGWLYITTRTPSAVESVSHLHLKSSSDQGRTWSADTIVDGFPLPVPQFSTLKTSGNAAVLADGTIVAVYPTRGVADCVVLCLAAATSADGGKTFERRVAVDHHLPQTPYRTGHVVLADPSREGSAVLIWVDGRNDKADVMMSRTGDRGATWSEPTRVNDDPIDSGFVQDFPWAAFAPDGRLFLAWRDRRLAASVTEETTFDIFTTTSADGGRTLAANRRLSDATSVQSPPWGPGNDFIGAAAANAAGYAAWADYRTGAWAIFFGSIPFTPRSPTP